MLKAQQPGGIHKTPGTCSLRCQHLSSQLKINAGIRELALPKRSFAFNAEIFAAGSVTTAAHFLKICSGITAVL